MNKKFNSALSVVLAILIVLSSAVCGVAVNSNSDTTEEITTTVESTTVADTSEEATTEEVTTDAAATSTEETTATVEDTTVETTAELSTEVSTESAEVTTTEAVQLETTTETADEETTQEPSTTEPVAEVTTTTPSVEDTTAEEPTTEEPSTVPSPIKPEKVTFNLTSTKKGVVIKWSDVLSALDDKSITCESYVIYRKTSGTSWKAIVHTRDLEYTDKNVAYNETYYYTVRAYYYYAHTEEKVISDYDSAGTVIKTKYVVTPYAPTAEVYNKKYVKISWSKIPGATKYVLYRASASDGKYAKVYTGTSRKYNDKNTEPGTAYYYKVKAYSNNKASNASAYTECVFRAGVPVISKFTTTESSVKLQWKKISGADGYVIYRKTKSSDSWKKIKTVKSGDTISYTNKDIKGKYMYSMKAYHTQNGKNYYSALSSVYTTYTIGKVKTVKISADKENFINTIKWSKVSGATGYEIYMKIGSGKWELAGTSDSATRSVYHPVTEDTTYSYKIRAIYNDMTFAGYSDTKSIKVTWLPDYTVTLPSKSIKNKSYITVTVKNTGKKDMYIYNDGASFVTGDLTFEAQLSKSTKKQVVDSIKIPAGKTVTFYMHLPTSNLTYTTSCFIGFLFKVNGSIFVCAASYKEGTQTVFVGDEYYLF